MKAIACARHQKYIFWLGMTSLPNKASAPAGTKVLLVSRLVPEWNLRKNSVRQDVFEITGRDGLKVAIMQIGIVAAETSLSPQSCWRR
ncbi:hypothetical protein WJX82_001971 [Trebouxia sp. C0006]